MGFHNVSGAQRFHKDMKQLLSADARPVQTNLVLWIEELVDNSALNDQNRADENTDS